MSEEIRQLAEDLLSRLAEGFDADDPEGPATLRLQITFVTELRQTFTLAKRVARNALPREAHIAEER